MLMPLQGAYRPRPTFQTMALQTGSTLSGVQAGDIILWGGASHEVSPSGFPSNLGGPSGFTVLGGRTPSTGSIPTGELTEDYYKSQCLFAFKIAVGGETSIQNPGYDFTVHAHIRPKNAYGDHVQRLVDVGDANFNQNVNYNPETSTIFPVLLTATANWEGGISHDAQALFDGVQGRAATANDSGCAIAQISLPPTDTTYGPPTTVAMAHNKSGGVAYDNQALALRIIV